MNMQFLYGSLATVVFFVCLGLAYMAGQRSKKPHASQPVDEEQKRRAKAVQEHFTGLLNYDVEKATRKKVI